MGDPAHVAAMRLGRYQVLRHLATGGMAEVLLAREPQSGQYVVIKRIRRDQASDDRFVRMFLDEARLAASLHHPNVVQVFEIGQEGGESFFAMEYVHGEDLRRVLMECNRLKDKVPIALVTGIVAAAAAGLHHAHEQHGADGQLLGIVHRDVSPANILVGYNGNAKVADFGIAKAVLRSVETRSGTLKGKVSYMSPEQVTGRPIDRRSDVFALGICLYEVATARRLFKGDNDFLTMSAIVQGDIPLPSVHRPDLPRILEDIIMKALSPNPAHRHQTAEELRVELEKFTHAIGMRMSASSIADYMKKLFGTRIEPWLVDEEPTATTTIDFDGSASGVVQPPASAVQSHKMPDLVNAAPSSLIVLARTDVTGRPPTEQVAILGHAGDPARWDRGQVPGEPLAWATQPRTGSSPPTRRRLGIVLGAAATAVLAGVILVVRASTGSSTGPDPASEPQPVPMTAIPPPPPEVADPAPAEPVVARPAPAAVVVKPAVVAKPEPAKVVKRDPLAKPIAAKAKPPIAKAQARPVAPVEIAKPKPAPAKKATRPPPTKAESKTQWDPDALFPK